VVNILTVVNQCRSHSR